MRLIDADKLLENYSSEDMAIGGTDIIKTAPTVDAIPIEWLNEWSKKYLEPVKEYTDIIEDIMNDWREERGNEITVTDTSV